MEDQEPTTPQEESASLGTLITDVFSSPQEAFTAISQGPPKHSRWLIPLFVSLCLMLGSLYLLSTHATFSAQMQDAQVAGLQQQVDEGKMTQDQADRISEQMGGSNLFLIFGSIFGSIFVLLYFVVAALVLWLASKFALKAEQPYGKYLELYGLSSWIGILGGVVTLMMMLGMDTIYASASPALAVLSNFDPMNTTHKVLKALDLFGAWQAVVAGVGISVFARKDAGVGIGVALALWLVWVGASVALGFAR